MSTPGNFPIRRIDFSKGTRLKFDLFSTGREIDWEVPSVNLKAKKNVIWAETPDGKVIAAKEIKKTKDLHVLRLNLPCPSEIKAGDTISILMGTPEKIKKKCTRKEIAPNIYSTQAPFLSLHRSERQRRLPRT